MENIKENLIRELMDMIGEIEEQEYILGMQGEPPTDILLPENDELLDFIAVLNEVLKSAYNAGHTREPYKLLLSDTYMTGIEKSLQ